MTDDSMDIRDVGHLREALELLGSLVAASDDELAVAVVGDLRSFSVAM